MTRGPLLLAVQLVDAELDQLRARAARLAERAELARVEAIHAGVQTAIAKRRDEVAGAVAEIDDCERRGAELDRQRARLDSQMKTIISPREAEALTHEIEVLRLRRSDVDDRELAAMEQQADAEAALLSLADDESTAAAAVAVARQALDVALGDLAALETEARERRRVAEAALEPDEVAFYTTTRSRHGGIGFVRVEGRTCSGCHVDMSTAEFEQVRAAVGGDLPECPNCGRLIVI